MIDSISEIAGAAPDLAKARRSRAASVETSAAYLSPPHSTEAEQGVLGCVLLDPKTCLGHCVEKFKSGNEVFYDLRHQEIWKSMTDLGPNKLDIITLQQHLKDRGLLDQVGGIYYLDQIQDSAPSAAGLSHYLDIVEEKRILRRVLSVCSDTSARVHNHETTTLEFLDGFERDALSIRGNSAASDDTKNLVLSSISDIEARLSTDGILGITTNLQDLDRQTDGLHGGELVIIAGFPSTGKTALAGNIAFESAISGIPSAFFSAEMSPMKIVSRAIFSNARVNKRFITELDAPKLTVAAGKISHAKIFVEQASGMSVSQIAAVSRRLHQKHGIKIIVVDYIQLISGVGDNREQEIASVSRGLKAIAMELNCCVIALSQLNDDGKLRESRAIGQDADSVWKLMNDGEWQPKVQPIRLCVEKSRDGETGVVELVFRKEFTRFENAAKVRDEDVPKHL